MFIKHLLNDKSFFLCLGKNAEYLQEITEHGEKLWRW